MTNTKLYITTFLLCLWVQTSLGQGKHYQFIVPKLKTLKLTAKQQDSARWDNGKLAYVATGISDSMIQWKVYAEHSPADSIFLTTKYQQLHGIYSEHREGVQVIGQFKNNQKHRVFVLKQKDKIVLYELWQNGKRMYVLDEHHQPSSQGKITTTFGNR